MQMGLLISRIWRKGRKKIRIFSILITTYMLAALAWWAILLYRQSITIYNLQLENSLLYPAAKQDLYRQKLMIGSEGFIFAGMLILGIMLLNHAFKAEIIAARQQKNFLLSVTHELKSPITAIQLILDTFKKRKLNEAQTIELINNGQEETHRLNRLVEDLLTAARLNPKSTISKKQVNIIETINTILIQYQKIHPQYEFNFSHKANSFICNTNEPSLHLIVSNLLDNAVKYSPELNFIKIDVEKTNSSVQVRIIDQGVGIPDHEKERIFDQFYRIGDENIRSSKGTGLGLYLVKELCVKLNIKVLVRDNKPKGSIFELQIPIT